MADEKGFCEKAEDDDADAADPMQDAGDYPIHPMVGSRWVHCIDGKKCRVIGRTIFGTLEMVVFRVDDDDGPESALTVSRFLGEFRPARPDKRHDRWINCYGDGSMTVHENGREASEQSQADSRGGLVECRHVTWTTKGE